MGLALAFLSGLAAYASLFGVFPAVNPVGLAITLFAALALALAAGFELSSWGAVVALLIAALAGGLVGSWLTVQISPDTTVEGLRGMSAALLLFFWFALFSIAPLAVILLAGVGIGKWRGMTLRRPRAPAAG